MSTVRRTVTRVVPILCVLFAIVAVAGPLRAMQVPTEWTQFRIDGTHNVVLDDDLNTSWTSITGGAISSSPAVSGSVLYIGNNHGDLNAIDIKTGQVIWSKHLANDLMSQPLLYGGLVIIGEGDEQSQGSAPGTVYIGQGPSALVALDTKTGDVKWRLSVAGSAMPTGAIVNNVLIEHNGAGWLTAVDPHTGKVLYTRNMHSIASMTGALPVGSNAIVTIGVLDNAVEAVRVADGATIWRTQFPAEGSGHGDCPPVTDGTILFCNYVMPKPPATYTSVDSQAIQHAYALDVRTGKKLWDVTLEGGILPWRNEGAIPMLMDGVVYFGSSVSPYMHALDAKTGRTIWEAKVHAPVKGGLVSTNGRVYFGDLKGYLWSLDAKTGKVVGVKKMRSGFNVGSPIVVGKTLIVGSRTGSLYAVPLADIDSGKDS
ncbi:MAG: PQQ-binding-like beta-propeller repeat protein [Candidatus Eremiobacteraeota bacterium]|nr:PQQ-binding-like beta-propeller repeat protein [Candidatus Eremiobacteraeota bacterium]